MWHQGVLNPSVSRIRGSSKQQARFPLPAFSKNSPVVTGMFRGLGYQCNLGQCCDGKETVALESCTGHGTGLLHSEQTAAKAWIRVVADGCHVQEDKMEHSAGLTCTSTAVFLLFREMFKWQLLRRYEECPHPHRPGQFVTSPVRGVPLWLCSGAPVNRGLLMPCFCTLTGSLSSCPKSRPRASPKPWGLLLWCHHEVPLHTCSKAGRCRGIYCSPAERCGVDHSRYRCEEECVACGRGSVWSSRWFCMWEMTPWVEIRR